MKSSKNAIVLCSGGIDSIVTAHYVKKKLDCRNVIIIFFNYGQKAVKMEEKYARNCVKELGGEFFKVNLEWLGNISESLINKKGKNKRTSRKDLRDTKKTIKDWYVPFRNTVFLSYALALAEARKIKDNKLYDIFTGFKNEGKESYPDTTIEYLSVFNELQKTAGGKYSIIAPLIKKDKEEIILLGKKLGVDFKKTFSCYMGKNKHCGVCLACRLRQEGFYWANVRDPTRYRTKMSDFRLASN